MSGFYLIWERQCYAVLLVSYIIFKTDVTLIGLCLSHSLIPSLLLVVVIVNEMFLDKVSLYHLHLLVL